ncbi:MAG: hypothetical protein Hals2KO_21860 [Halioglobus sp.]
MHTAQFYVGIGAQKAGTTWLGHYLHEHPQVAASPFKELHYFDAKYRPGMCGEWNGYWRETLTDLTTRYAAEPSEGLLLRMRCAELRLEMTDKPERYKQYFAALIEESTRAFGEITPSYSLLPPAGFEEIISHYPRARFIFVARDPVDRFLSQVRFNCKQRNIQLRDAVEADSLALSFLKNPHFSRRSDYRTTLTNLYRVVPQEQVRVMFFEHVFNTETNAEEMRGLCDFLQIDYVPARLAERLNSTEAVDYSSEVIRQVRSAAQPVYDYMRETFGDQVPAVWR